MVEEIIDVIECFKIKETGKVHCYVEESFHLSVLRASKTMAAIYGYKEVSFNELPRSVKEAINRLEAKG